MAGDRFLAEIAHELRNPLSALHHAVDMAKTIGSTEPLMQTALATMSRQLVLLKRLVDDLMDLGRIAAGHLTLGLAPVRLGDVVARSMEMCAASIAARGHRTRVVVDDPELTVAADRDRLVQIVTNLIGNSAKYTPPNGEISVLVQRDSTAATIKVVDNGIGIAAGDLQEIFAPFSQVHAYSPREGLGIGLFVVKSLVELHGGTVEAESQGPGAGSTFTVRLPLPAATAV
jgi:signal transduction histidine kinase